MRGGEAVSGISQIDLICESQPKSRVKDCRPGSPVTGLMNVLLIFTHCSSEKNSSHHFAELRHTHLSISSPLPDYSVHRILKNQLLKTRLTVNPQSPSTT